MGLYDRDYYRKGGRSGLGGLSGLSVNTWIIIVNIVVFLIGGLGPTRIGMFPFKTSPLFDFGHFSTFTVTLAGGLQFWRFLTFQFLHDGPVHVGFNMLGLYIFGGMVEEHLGSKKYLAFYLTCGVFGALMYLLLNAAGNAWANMGMHQIPGLLFEDTKTQLIGASAGVLGVIMACAYIAPEMRVQLMFPPIPMKMRTLAYLYVALAIFNLIFGGHNAGGDAAHVGGAAAGALFIRNSHLLRDFFDVFSDSRKKPAKGTLVGGSVPRPSQRPSEEEEREIDRILAKVKAEGITSLTEAEKGTLRRDTDNRRTSG